MVSADLDDMAESVDTKLVEYCMCNKLKVTRTRTRLDQAGTKTGLGQARTRNG